MASALLAPAAAQPAPVAAVAPARAEARQLVREIRALRDQYLADDTLRENLARAEALCARAVQLDPADPEPWALYSWVCGSFVSQGYDRSAARYAATRQYAEEAVKVAPDSTEALFALASSFRLQNATLPEAERRLRELVNRAPDEKRFLRMLAFVLRREGKNFEALAFLDRAAALPGGDTRALMNRVPILMDLGREAEAEASVDRSLALEPSRKTALIKINFLRARGDVAQARTELAKLPPAILREEQGACVAALVWCWSREPEKMLAVLAGVPGDYFNFTFYEGPKGYLAGWAHALAGRSEAAQAEWRRAAQVLDQRLADQSVSLDLLSLKAELLARVGAKDEAAQILRLHQSVQDRNQSEVAGDVAITLALLGKQETVIDFLAAQLNRKADPLLRAALRLNPAYDVLRDHPRFVALLAEPKASAPDAPAAPAPRVEARQLVATAHALYQQFVNDDTLRENLVAAEELCQRAITLEPEGAEAWILQARVSASFIGLGYDRSPARYAATRSQAEQAVKLAPDSLDARYALASSYRLQNSTLPEAERQLRELVDRAPDDQRFLRMLGIVLRREGRNQAALEFFDRAAALAGGDPKALMLRVPILMDLGRASEAESSIDRSLALLPSRKTRLTKINFLRLRGDLEQARAELGKLPPAVLLEEQGACTAAWVWFWSREPDKMLNALESMQGEDCKNDFYEGPKSYLLGWAHQLAGRGDAARAEWRRSLQLVAQQTVGQAASLDSLCFRAELLARVGDPDAAARVLSLYQMAKGRTDAEVTADVVTLFLLLGRHDAVLDFFAARMRSGDDPNLRDVLRLSPAYDALRTHSRFATLLAAPAAKP